jgi:hypothetical protein
VRASPIDRSLPRVFPVVSSPSPGAARRGAFDVASAFRARPRDASRRRERGDARLEGAATSRRAVEPAIAREIARVASDVASRGQSKEHHLPPRD